MKSNPERVLGAVGPQPSHISSVSPAARSPAAPDRYGVRVRYDPGCSCDMRHGTSCTGTTSISIT